LSEKLLASRSIPVRDNLRLKLKIFGPEIYGRPEAEVGFTKGDIG
jgi:hypothetical protein